MRSSYVKEIDPDRGIITLSNELDTYNFQVGMIFGRPPWHYRLRVKLVRAVAWLLRVSALLLFVACYGGEYDITKRPCTEHADCNVPNDAGTINAVCAADDICHYLCRDETNCPEGQICHFDPWSLLNVCWDDAQ